TPQLLSLPRHPPTPLQRSPVQGNVLRPEILHERRVLLTDGRLHPALHDALKYQACPDVPGSESLNEELTCLAAWKEGSNRYLVGKAYHFLATSDEDRYRCFVYKSWDNGNETGVRMALSGDATCNGLFSIAGGSMTLILKKVDTSRSGCRFPHWLATPHWHSLDGHMALRVTRRNATLHLAYPRSHQGPVTHTCLEQLGAKEVKQQQQLQIHKIKKSATFVTHVIKGCESGYQCVHVKERDNGVMEMLMGRWSQVDSLACKDQYFDPNSSNYTTFVSSAVEKRQCPVVGRYEVIGTSERRPTGGRRRLGRGYVGEGRRPFTTLDVGCSTIDTLVIGNACSSSEYSCIGWWQAQGRQYVVVTPKSRSSKGVRRLCLTLVQRVGGEGGILSLASSALSCGRNLTQGFLGYTILNATIIDKAGCGTNDSFSVTKNL
ncbi:hypothetical protein Pmani_037629, partial [Petrolisthes manimaculis]